MPMSEPIVYQALALPDEAFDKGGLEILRAGLVDDELYVSALRAFDDPATWGEVLGDIARRLGKIFAAEGKLSEKEALAAIASTFAADLGAPIIKKSAPRRKRAAPGKSSKAARGRRGAGRKRKSTRR